MMRCFYGRTKMKTYDLLVIGFGKAGKTLAAKMSSLGKKVLQCMEELVSILAVFQQKH